MLYMVGTYTWGSNPILIALKVLALTNPVKLLESFGNEGSAAKSILAYYCKY
jgi:hypothetical protein